MKGIIAICVFSLLAAATAQYPYRRAPTAPSQHSYQPEPQQGPSYRPAPQEEPIQEPRPQVRRRTVHPAAPVHYVNIGPELQGDYKFGYDTGKGDDGQSFREETRLPDGTVQGAYGYIDETGKQRIVKYTAGKDGFKVVGDTEASGAPKPAAPATPVQVAPRRPPTPQYYQQPAPQHNHAARSSPPRQAIPQRYAQQEQYPEQDYSAPESYGSQERNPIPLLQTFEKRPSYRQQSYEPQPQYQYQDDYSPRPRVRSNRYYDDDNNDISEEPIRVVPIDTSLFSYNIGIAEGVRRV